MRRISFLMVFVSLLGPTSLGAKSVTVDMKAGEEKRLTLPYSMSRQCEIAVPKKCVALSRSDLVEFEIVKGKFDTAGSAMSVGKSKCVPASDGKIMSEVFGVSITSKEASSNAAFGYDQITVVCTMPSGAKASRYFEIGVLP